MPRVTLDLPRWLLAVAEDHAERDGVSLDRLIALALAEKVGAKGAEAFLA